MNAKSLLIALAPWVLFSMGSEHLGPAAVGPAAALACLGSLALAVHGMRHGGLKIIDAAGVATFAVIAGAGFLGGTEVDLLLAHYARGGAALILAGVMAVSALTVPFTEQYARQTVDRRYWASPEFRAKNRAISFTWAGVLLVMSICHFIAGALAASSVVPGAHPGNIILNWVIPVLLVLRAIKRTELIAEAGTAPELALR